MNNQSTIMNPFKVFTPEEMDAEDVHALFVDPFTDFAKIRDAGHTIADGPRGCGKSMIFRYLLPDCQCLAHDKKLNELPFLAFLISIKNTGPNLTEFRRLADHHANIVLNEHVLTVYFAAKVFSGLSRLTLPTSESARDEAVSFLATHFTPRLAACGYDAETIGQNEPSAQAVFDKARRECDTLYTDVVQYGRRLAFPDRPTLPYVGALCGYMDFLFPVLERFKSLTFLPNGPAYLLVDDADYLSRTQAMVLNSWVSTRTQKDVSIKISTQLRYKTYATVSGLPLQSPHDYQSISIADIYTTKHGRYLSRVEEIIKKRLIRADIKVSPREFFPTDIEQEKAIAVIAKRIREEFPVKGRGHRADDDALRYARPEYIRSLGGPAKSSSSYSYSGFEQLVHISSGLIRYFLEPAAVMFDEARSTTPGAPINEIDPSIQNHVIRDEADALMLSEFDKIVNEEVSEIVSKDDSETQLAGINLNTERLKNLISALGGTFYLKLISDDSERRVFSIAISGIPDRELLEVFELGVRYGYFHRSSIGNKEGTGRTRLYVLTRRLAPYFKLDPSSFAGYLWVTGDVLFDAMSNPERFIRKVRGQGVSNYFESQQLALFE